MLNSPKLVMGSADNVPMVINIQDLNKGMARRDRQFSYTATRPNRGCRGCGNIGTVLIHGDGPAIVHRFGAGRVGTDREKC